ncbi:MAG: DUF4340 domain-containing protein [Planctomycetes bacterium]|nr:DUF4340 domain-containing protein [Planctomycetota bacterium]
MSPRNRILMAVFVVLFASLLLQEQPWRGDAHARTFAATTRMFPELTQHQGIGRIRIQSATQTTTIAQILDQGKPRWVVSELWDHPADLARVGSLIESLQALETRDIESVNPEMQDAYEVSPETGVRVEVWNEDGDLLADVIAGSMRSQDVTAGQVAVFEFFVRPTAGNTVYRTGEFTIPFTSPADWCDTHFLSQVEAGQFHTLQRVDLNSNNSWKLIRQDNPVENGAPLDQAEAEEGATGRWRMVAPDSLLVPNFVGDSWIFTLNDLRAANVIGLIEEAQNQELLEPVTDIIRAGIGGETFEIQIGQLASNNNRYARVVGLPHLYALQEFDVDQLLQSVEKMRRAD